MNYQDINSETIDSWIEGEGGWEWGTPISHEVFLSAKQGDWHMLLTPQVHVPKEWYPELKGRRVLGLASGGGQQMPIFAALGAECTVLDYSRKQLESEQMVSEREGYDINLIRADMTKPLPFADESFDLIFHPVSNGYIEDVLHVWRECFRILKPDGRLMAGMGNGFEFVTDWGKTEIKYSLPYNPLKNKELYEQGLRNNEGVQFSHTLNEQIRGQLHSGFRLIDCYEDVDTQGTSAKFNIPVYWATLAEKPKA
ncbi:MAG: class I SAM-dependent methyltransferase [Clostridiales bacterium]|nr:class I SAM-dependent methyltransferase [Clostridiales bacterium]